MTRPPLAAAIFLTATAAATPATVVVEPLNGPPQTGQIKSWSLESGLSLEGAAESKPIDSSDLSRITNTTAVERLAPGSWTFITTDGQRILGTLESGDEAHITVRHATLGPLVLPIESIASIVAAPSQSARAAPGESDHVVLANGDVAAGIIRELNRDKLRIADGNSENERSIDAALLRRADFANPSTQPAAGLAAVLRLTDGSIIRASDLTWRDENIDVVLLGRQRARLAPDSVRVIEIGGGPLTWLSEIDPTAFEHTPVLGPRLPLGRDVNALGRPLATEGRRHDRGLGLHSAQRVEYALDRDFTRLRASVAVDDTAGPLADATLRITVDGREVARLDHLRAKQAPRRIDVDIANAERLGIEVEPADNADIQDRVDLIDAALLKLK